MKTEKPLCDWTLQEVKEMCRSKDIEESCADCRFALYGDTCTFAVYNKCSTIPSDWEFPYEVSFSGLEIMTARALLKALGDGTVNRIDCGSKSTLYLERDGNSIELIDSAFPSVKVNDSVPLSEIASGYVINRTAIGP